MSVVSLSRRINHLVGICVRDCNREFFWEGLTIEEFGELALALELASARLKVEAEQFREEEAKRRTDKYDVMQRGFSGG